MLLAAVIVRGEMILKVLVDSQAYASAACTCEREAAYEGSDESGLLSWPVLPATRWSTFLKLTASRMSAR